EFKLGRLDDLTPLFPEGTERIGDVSGNTIADWEIDLVGHFLRFVDGVDAGCDNRNAERFELS
ncbi:MAG: hypothetical protein AAGD43_31195, partial [Pseudomonadota bacterium]